MSDLYRSIAMKQNIPQLLAAAGLLTVASAKYSAQVRYSDSVRVFPIPKTFNIHMANEFLDGRRR
jgi:hypothetical protein